MTIRPLLALLFAVAASAGETTPDQAKAELRQLAPEFNRFSRVLNLVHQVAAPSVVSIRTRERVIDPSSRRMAVREMDVGEGSGFVFHSDAEASWVITNAHVVLQTDRDQNFVRNRQGQYEGYDRLRVVLNDNREADATYVGTDVRTDLAVLRVPIPRLPALEWADSDQVHVGDYVIALGYPLDVGFSATFGNVSATDRATGIYGAVQGFESFIQTDAAINPGNSGGPLVDIQARLIGVNANIVTRGGGSIGLGFAIPANLVKRVAEDLREFGKVRLPVIGVDLAANPDRGGAGFPRVRTVLPETPAAQAGVQVGDQVVAIDGVRVQSWHHLRARLATARIGTPVRLMVQREGKEQELSVVPIEAEALTKRLNAIVAEQSVALPGLGISVAADGRPGLAVTAIDPQSAVAEHQLFDVGDRILSERTLGELSTREHAQRLAAMPAITVLVLSGARSFWLRLRRP